MSTLEYCLRCQSELLDITPSEVNEIRFFGCKACKSQYAKSDDTELHDRWGMPMTLPLYMVIFADEPMDALESAVKEMQKIQSKNPDFIDILCKHIDAEISKPTQKISQMLNFVRPNEQKLRAFLQALRDRLTNQR